MDESGDLGELLRDRGFLHSVGVTTVRTAAAGLRAVDEARPDAVLLAVADGSAGTELCCRLVARHPGLPVVIVADGGGVELVIRAIRAGAYDFIARPVEPVAIAAVLQRATRHRAITSELERVRAAVREPPRIEGIVGESQALRAAFELIEAVAGQDATVLITGDSGTGKELVARALHARSPRARGPFVAVNCAAMPATLLESTLFGHVKGAFTSAHRMRAGLFVQADGGTVLLDEIGEMPLEMQAKLLRALQERKVRPLGAVEEVDFDVRVAAATHRDLEAEVAAKRFRADLYYRINVVAIHMPRLCDRPGDVLLLAHHFLRVFAERSARPVRGLGAAAAERLLEYPWPGNVRELQNTIEGAVALARFEEITPDDLPPEIREYGHAGSRAVAVDPDGMLTLEEAQRRYVGQVLQTVAGNRTRAAQVLGVDRRTLRRKMSGLVGAAR